MLRLDLVAFWPGLLVRETLYRKLGLHGHPQTPVLKFKVDHSGPHQRLGPRSRHDPLSDHSLVE